MNMTNVSKTNLMSEVRFYTFCTRISFILYDPLSRRVSVLLRIIIIIERAIVLLA